MPTDMEKSADAEQTHRSFNDKWNKNPSLAVKQTLDPSSSFNRWIMERNGWAAAGVLRERLVSCKTILDAGCGNGRITALLASLAPQAKVMGVDIVALEPARFNTAPFPNATLTNHSLRSDLSPLGVFDFIYCQEVLHHTGDAEGAFRNLVQVLNPGGTIAIYVYRKKAPAREFMDDHVRAAIAGMNYEQAMVVCRQITEFGRRLSEVEREVELEAIPELGIEAGSYTPQRVIYNFFMKCYWNPDLTFEENAVINYDWYHPTFCSRHELTEVREWMTTAGLRISWEFQDLYGITMHGVR